ncbi:TlpA family protein disulfide reductase [Balneola sp. MJW-20]|uniref:TlpA family protein disulfide reductase n=1 Tax=Gracilimonas aurantiaca TaxID=3234185 RepID=UPI003464E95F
MKENDSPKKPSAKHTFRRNLIEWTVILGVAGLLYVTGYHTEVIGTIQRVLLATGIHQPHTPLEDASGFPRASYQLRMTSIEGEHLSLADLKGKTLFLNFWATWCPPCIAEMPNIQGLYNELNERDDIEFLMISLDEDPEKARDFIQRKGFSFPVYFPLNGLPAIYNKAIVPRTFVISPEGDIVIEHEGMAKYNTNSFKDFLLSL